MLRYVAILLVGFASTVQATTVVVNDNIGFHHPLSSNEVSFQVWKSIAKCDQCYTGVGMKYENETIKGTSLLLDYDQSDWYLVEPGDAFGAASIKAGQFPVILNSISGGSGTRVVGPGDFYLGVNTGDGGGLPPVPPRDIFGWVHMRPVNGILTMVENAMVYGGKGIIVGTPTVVPEPASAMLAFVAIGMLAGRRRR